MLWYHTKAFDFTLPLKGGFNAENIDIEADGPLLPSVSRTSEKN